MAVLAVTYGRFCRGEEIVAGIRQRLNYEVLGDNLFEIAAQAHSVAPSNLRRTLTEAAPSDGRLPVEHERLQSALQVELAEFIQFDQRIVTGCPAYLIPGDISHVLRVCVVADKTYRLSIALKDEGLAHEAAEHLIHQSDEQLACCSTTSVQKAPFDKSLFDVVIATNETSTKEAIENICTLVNSEAVRYTDRSRRAAESFLLASRVRLALTSENYSVEVFVEEGRAVVGVNNRAFLVGRMMEKVKRLAAATPGISNVQVKLGSKYASSSLNPWEAVETPPRVLLVDDEQEFVNTLSERLRTRSIESNIAYSGEDALEMLKSGGADIIVLDLMMPGIDGIETLRRVKRLDPNVEVIILTGHGSDREQAAAEDLGAFAYLRKPVNLNDLAQVMKEAYAQRQRGR